VRPAPTEDPWAGKGPPKPLRQVVRAWTQPVRGVVGMTAGDWDLRGENDLIALAKDTVLTLDPETGKLRRKLSVGGISDRVPPVAVRWAELRKGQSAILHYRGGWPDNVPVV